MTVYTCHCSFTTCCSCTAPLAPRPVPCVLMSRDFLFEVQRLFLHTHHMVCASWTTWCVSLICVGHCWLTCFCQCFSLVCACTLLLSSTFDFSISKCSTFVSSSCPNMHKWSNGFQPPIVSGSNERHVVVNKFPLALSVWAVLQPPQSMCIYLLEPKLCGRVLVSTRVVLVWALYSTQHPALLNYNLKMLTTITGKTAANVHLISHWRASLCRCAEETDEPKKTPRTDPSNESTSSPTRNHTSANSTETDQSMDH